MAILTSHRYRITIVVLALGLPLTWLTIVRAAAPTWTAAPPMAQARALATATSLPDGRVLVTGGADLAASVALSSAEVFDPASDTWSPAGTMSAARYYHVAAALADGRVLVAGGQSYPAGLTNGAELFDTASMTWSPVAPMNHGRVAATAVTLNDGRVLVIGGFDIDAVAVVMDAEIYDPVTNSWSLTGATTGPRFFATAQVLPDGRVLVAGGYDNVAFDSVETAEVFDPATNNWTAVEPMHVRRVFSSSVSLSDGRVLVIGGARAAPAEFWLDAEVYDPAFGSWTLTPSTGGAGGPFAGAARRTDGRVLVAGGWTMGGTPANLAALYDPATNTWSDAAPMSTARYGHIAIPIPGARTLVAGGVGGTDQAEIFGSPNNAPIAEAGDDQALQGCAGCLALATLDGSRSSDADGDALTYTWREGATILASSRGGDASATVGLGVGTHMITLTVTDGAGGTATDSTSVIVNDAIGALSGQVAALEANLAEARNTIEHLNGELAELRADHRELTRGLDEELSDVERDMRAEFRDPRFTIQGRTPLARLTTLAEAIVRLNHGQKQALYKNLGGR